MFTIWQLTQSGQFPTHQFGISISILCFKSIHFIKSQIWQHYFDTIKIAFLLWKKKNNDKTKPMLKKSSNLRKKPTQLKKEKRTLFQAVATGENVVSTAFPFGICE